MKKLKLSALAGLLLILAGCGTNSASWQTYDGLIPVQLMSENQRYGLSPSSKIAYMTLNGEEVFSFEKFHSNYGHRLGLFSNGLALVNCISEGAAFVNEKGESVIRLSDYGIGQGLGEGATGFSENRAILRGEKEGVNSYLIIDNKGTVIFTVPCNEKGIRPVTLCKDGMIVFENRSGREWMIYNKDGKLLRTEEKYKLSDLTYPYQGLFCVYNENQEYGAIDSKGEVVIPFEYKRDFRFDNNGYAVVKDKDGKIGLINMKNKYVMAPGDYESIETAGKDQYICETRSGKSICNHKGELVEILFKGHRDGNGYYPVQIPLKEGKYLAVTGLGSYGGGSFALMDDKGDFITPKDKFYAIFSYGNIGSPYRELEEYYKFGTPYNADYFNSSREVL